MQVNVRDTVCTGYNVRGEKLLNFMYNSVSSKVMCIEEEVQVYVAHNTVCEPFSHSADIAGNDDRPGIQTRLLWYCVNTL